MTVSRAGGAQVLRSVLLFTWRHWTRRKAPVVAVAIGMSLATLTEVFVPLYAGRLVDALASGPSTSADGGSVIANRALDAFAMMAAPGLAMIALRHLAWSMIVPLTLDMMSSIAREAFHRVQRFSTDWHANGLAGSTVSKVTRGMWALDSLNDLLLLTLLPACVVLVGTMMLLGRHWAVMGIVMTAGALAYVALSVMLATRVIAPASRLSNAQDTRIGGALADALGSHASLTNGCGARAAPGCGTPGAQRGN